MNPNWKQVFTRPDFLLAFGFGSGLVPRAPGTAGSVVGLLLFIPALSLPLWVQLAMIVVGFIVGVFVSGRVADELELKDPAGIVWDEVIGMWITMLWLPSLYWAPVAFVLFRFFDIAKPWPVSVADREVAGGLGIMLDDVAAALYALAGVQLLYFLYGQFF
jgi:phosphatidylglycerophosphatase A